MAMTTLARTSTTHPLQIASIRPRDGFGRIGITFCPGKKQPLAMTGGWERDLCTDVDALKHWGAAAVISLIEDHEIESLGVSRLGEEVLGRHMEWTGRCFDIGITVSGALQRWQRSGEPLAGSTDPYTAGNGSLMRLAPVAILHWRDREKLRQVAALQSRTTHGAPEAVSACVGYG